MICARKPEYFCLCLFHWRSVYSTSIFLYLLSLYFGIPLSSCICASSGCHRIDIFRRRYQRNTFTRDGYEFRSWNTRRDGSGRKFSDGCPVELEGDITLYAQWEEVKEESHEERNAQPSWTPEQAAATIAAEKAAKQQAAGTQMAAVQTLLRTFATTKPGGPGEVPTVINLDMTKVDILDRSTVNLLVLNNKFEYNIKISVAGGLINTVKIPAGFNFRPFIKADGTMNIHEVLWSIILSRK